MDLSLVGLDQIAFEAGTVDEELIYLFFMAIVFVVGLCTLLYQDGYFVLDGFDVTRHV